MKPNPAGNGPPDPVTAVEWLRRQLLWERRLDELHGHDDAGRGEELARRRVLRSVAPRGDRFPAAS
jgi:hypothetical protein